MKARLLLVAIGLAACSAGEGGDTARITIENIEVAAPLGWEARRIGPTTSVWTPVDNPRRESIAVIVRPAPLGNTERALGTTRTALGVLRDLYISSSDPVTTREGLAGMRFDLRFRSDAAPARLTERSHVVLVAGNRIVHVLYTAATPDPAHAVLDGVVGSLRIGGG